MAGTARGFTWVELCIILVVAIGIVFFVRSFWLESSSRRRRSICDNNLRQIAVAIQIYAGDHDEGLPPANKMWSVLYLDPSTFKCPAKGMATPNAYAYNINLSSRWMGTLLYPNQEVAILDSKNISGGFNTNTGTSAPNYRQGSAANALMCADGQQPLPNIYYAPGDEEQRHDGFINVSYFDGHVGTTHTNPEADVQWQSADNPTISYGPSAINNVETPATCYNLVQPHVGSAVEGANLQQTHSTLGVILGRLSWRFSKENVADTKECTIGFGCLPYSRTSTALFYSAVGNHGKVTFYQNHLNAAGTAFGAANQVGSAITYTSGDVFSISCDWQTIDWNINGKKKAAISDATRGPIGHASDTNAKMQIFVFTAPGANKRNGVTNVMATGLR